MVIVMIATVTAVVACRRSIARCRTHVLGPGELHAPLASVDCLKDGFATRKLPDVIDDLIIGSGVSGLLTAALLAKVGHTVVVLEQHDRAGGCTHTFDEAGFEFDTGLHYVGDVLGILLGAGTTGTIEWACTGSLVDEVVAGEDRIAIRFPKTAFFDELRSVFPKQHSSIDAYARKLDSSRLALAVRIALKLCPCWLHARVLPLVDSLLPLTTTHEVLSSITQDTKLRNLLSYIWGTFGLPPSRSPFAMTAVIQTHYFNGAYYPVGGCSQIAARLVPTITGAGGKVLVRAPVDTLLFDTQGGACVGAMVRGKAVRARRVISAAGMLNTLKLCPAAERPRLLVPGGALRDSPPLRCDNRSKHDDGTVEPSNAFAYLFIGLEAIPDEADGGSEAARALAAALAPHNLWVLPSWEHERDSALPPAISSADEHPLLLFISSPSSKDPAWQARHPGKHVVVALAPTRFEYWSERGDDDARIHHRGHSYDDFKQRMQERMLARVLDELPPGLARHVRHVTLGSPLSSNFFLGTAWGEAYGLEHSARRFSLPFLRPSTPIPNLLLTGQDVALDGVAGAAVAAFLTASIVDLRVPLTNLTVLAAMAMNAS